MEANRLRLLRNYRPLFGRCPEWQLAHGIDDRELKEIFPQFDPGYDPLYSAAASEIESLEDLQRKLAMTALPKYRWRDNEADKAAFYGKES